MFKYIEENSEFILLYNEKWIDINRRVNIDVKDLTVEEILNQAFEGTRMFITFMTGKLLLLEMIWTNSQGIPSFNCWRKLNAATTKYY